MDASPPTESGDTSSLPPEVIAFAGRMYDAARAGDLAIFEQALPAGLPANMTNEKGDSLVHTSAPLYIRHPSLTTAKQRS